MAAQQNQHERGFEPSIDQKTGSRVSDLDCGGPGCQHLQPVPHLGLPNLSEILQQDSHSTGIGNIIRSAAHSEGKVSHKGGEKRKRKRKGKPFKQQQGCLDEEGRHILKDAPVSLLQVHNPLQILCLPKNKGEPGKKNTTRS